MEAATDQAAQELLGRVCRDLEVPAALLLGTRPHRWVTAHAGFGDPGQLRALVASIEHEVHVSDAIELREHGLRSFVSLPVGANDGLLVAADRRRRWFCHDERRHLQLLATPAAQILAQAQPALDLRSAGTVPALVRL